MACILCKHAQYEKMFRVERLGKRFAIVRCKNCGLVFQHPFPKNINGLYDDAYFSGHGFDATVDYQKEIKTPGWRTQFNRLRLHYLEAKAPGKKLLDVGCAFGFFLSVAKKQGWDVHGVELSPHAAKGAQRPLGKDRIHQGTLEDAPFKKNSFDCITLFDVIEHVPDPMQTIASAYELLGKEGIVVIETANVDSLVAKIRKEHWTYFLLGHLHYFSRKTLRQALTQAGFLDIEILYGDEISILQRVKMAKGFSRKVRSLLFSSARKIGVGDLCVGGMVAIAKK